MVDVMQTIRGHEGFKTHAYWDVNAWRVGYGSDTYVDSSGNVKRVTQDTVITREQAEQDLQRRVPEFINSGILPYVDRTAWNALPQVVKDSVTSVSYNYGGINELRRLRTAINSGDPAAIADVIESYGSHNGGVNQRRRTAEANAIRNAQGVTIPPGEIPNVVASEIDVTNPGGINLTALLPDNGAPTPQPRFKGDLARSKASARAPKPAPAEDRVKADMAEVARQSLAMIASGGTKLPANGRLPAVPLSANQGNSNAGKEGDKRIAGLVQSSKGTAERKPSQSQIERNPPSSPAAGTILDPLRISAEVFTPMAPLTIGQTLIPQSQIERNKPAPTQRTHDLGKLTETNTPGVMRITGGNQAGQVAMPKGERPNVTVPNLDRLAETLPNGSNPKSLGFTYAGETDKPTKAAPKQSNAKVIPGQSQIERTAQEIARMAIPGQSQIERVTPKQVQRIASSNIAEQRAEQNAVRRTAAKPVTQKVAENAKVTRQAAVDDSIVVAGEPVPAVSTPATRREQKVKEAEAEFDLFEMLGLGSNEDPFGMQSIGQMVGDLFGSAKSAARPLSAQQIADANRNSANHNSAALAAINRGERSYSNNGAVTPTTAMNGNVRNTYGDDGGNNGSISSM